MTQQSETQAPMDKTDKLEALLPCPFCQQEVRATPIEGAGYSLVGCGDLNCPASSVSCYPHEWNTRTPSPVAATVDAETPFSLDDVVQQLNRVLGLLESIEDHNGKMSVQEPLPKARVILRGLIGHLGVATAAPSDSSIQAAARHYSCSCGGALTAEEYIEHYFEKGHDQGEPQLLIRAAAAEIINVMIRVPKFVVDREATLIELQERIAAILSKHLGSAAVGEQDSLSMVVARKAAQEPCRSYAKGCAANQPEESFWCAPCTARHLLAATPTSTQT